MNKEEILGAFSLVNNPIVLSEEEVKDVQKAIELYSDYKVIFINEEAMEDFINE